MPIHEEVLEAAVRICRHRGAGTFSPGDVVRELPHLNPSSVRTHVISRCCVNAPKNHPHKWDYFRRVGRGRYEVLSAYRTGTRARRPGSAAVAQRTPLYGRSGMPTLHETIHAVVRRDQSGYVAECLEVAVVTRGRSLDELVTSLEKAVELHVQGQGPRALGLAPSPRLVLQYEVTSRSSGEAAGPSWKRPRARVVVKGASLTQTILEARRRGR